jgi:hypothetical protein
LDINARTIKENKIFSFETNLEHKTQKHKTWQQLHGMILKK